MKNVTSEELRQKASELAANGLGLDDAVKELKHYFESRPYDEHLEDNIPEIVTAEIYAEMEKQTFDMLEVAPEAISEPISDSEPSALPPEHKAEPAEEKAAVTIFDKEISFDEYADDLTFKRQLPDGTWQTRYCSVCRHFDKEMCCDKPTEWFSITRSDDKGRQILMVPGKQAVGLMEIRRPKTEEERAAEREQNIEREDWWTFFDSVEQIGTDGPKEMLIENFLNPGVTFICGPIKEGKTLLCLEIAAALSTGRPLFDNPKFKVNRPIPVIYLQTDMGSDLFKQWALDFRIPNDKRKFLTRTRDKIRVDMRHPDIINAVRRLKPVVIVDSIYRYIDGQENTEDYLKIVEAVDELIREGARSVIAVVHSTKSFREKPTKENAVRGSAILGAAADTIVGLLQDVRKFKNNAGPNEVDLFCWGRYIPDKLRFAITKRRDANLPQSVVTYKPNLQSYIDEQHHLHLLNQDEIAESKTASSKPMTIADLEELIQRNDSMSIREMIDELSGRISFKQAQRLLSENGWERARGYAGVWTKTVN